MKSQATLVAAVAGLIALGSTLASAEDTKATEKC